MKLQEDDAFTRVCVSVHGGSQVTITHDAMDLAVHAPHLWKWTSLDRYPLDMGPHWSGIPTSDYQWRSVQICPLQRPPPHADMLSKFNRQSIILINH